MSTPTRFEPEQLRNQHIAAIRRVRLATEASGEPTTGPEAIEIETKHGRIVHLSAAADTLELRSGAFRGTVTSAVATPPQRRRTQQDLTAELAAAFDGRPVIEAATRDGAGWRITLSTGASLVCSAGPQGLVIWCTAAPKPRPDSPAPAQRKHSLPEIERR